MRLFLALVFLYLASSTQAKDFSKVFIKVDPSVVVITTTETGQRLTKNGMKSVKSQGMGSGVIISAAGLIMTASHVVHSADEVMVQTANGNSYKARVISSSVGADVALIQLLDPPAKLPFIKPWDSDKVAIGEEVFVIGSPYGIEHTLTVGHLSGRRSSTGKDALIDVEFLQTDAAVNQGNSGGPMFNSKGKLIGIVSHIRTQSGGNEGLGFAASINMAKRILLEQSPLWLGIEFVLLKKQLIKALNVPYTEGLLVQRVAKGSFGDDLQVQAGSIPITFGNEQIVLGGDVIVEVGGNTVYVNRKGIKRTTDYLNGVASGEKIEITVFRAGKKLMLSATKP
ncbi:MAG: trypsin [Moraxellaceae bacterium]|nr:MAG: trypsin [Moraxellaceae bacterium]